MHGAFAAFLTELMPSGADYAAARAVAAEPLPVLRRRFGRAATAGDHLIAGSVGKHTALRPMPPVDLYFILPDAVADAEPEPTAVREEMAVALGLGPAALRDGWRVTLPRPRGLVAVVPCLAQDGAFLIPSPQGGWRLSNPAAEVAAFRLLDQCHGGQPMALLLLLKAWTRHNGVRLGSFTAEMLVREYFTTELGADAPAPLLAAFLTWARRRTPASLPLPGGRGARLEVGDAWHGHAEAAYWRCILAERLESGGEALAAAGEWRRMFGARFPVAALDRDSHAALPWPQPPQEDDSQ